MGRRETISLLRSRQNSVQLGWDPDPQHLQLAVGYLQKHVVGDIPSLSIVSRRLTVDVHVHHEVDDVGRLADHPCVFHELGVLEVEGYLCEYSPSVPLIRR